MDTIEYFGPIQNNKHLNFLNGVSGRKVREFLYYIILLCGELALNYFESTNQELRRQPVDDNETWAWIHVCPTVLLSGVPFISYKIFGEIA